MNRNERGEAGTGWLIVGIIFIILLPLGVWGFTVATSDVKGRGDSVITKNNSGNRIAAQERFEQMYSDIKASDAKIAPLQAAAKADPKDHVASTNLAGIKSYCLSVVADYEAAGRQYTQKDFKAADLPDAATLADDPSTDCK